MMSMRVHKNISFILDTEPDAYLECDSLDRLFASALT